MRRPLLESAAIALLATCYSFAQATFQASVCDERFALIALAAAGLGVAGGLAVASSTVAWLAAIPANTWLTASGVAMAITVAVALFTPFGTIITYLALPLASGASTALATLAVTTRWPDDTSSAGLRSLTVGGAVLLAMAATPVIVSRAGGPVQTTALAAGALCLVAFAIGAGKAAKVAGGTAAFLVLVTLQAPGSYLAPPRWTGDAAIAKPVYGQTRGGEAHIRSTRWDGFGRMDMVAYPQLRKDLLWVFTNGVLTGLAAAGAPGDADDQWRRRQFPLVTLALAAETPADLLVVAPAGGLVIRMALDAGIQHIHAIDEPTGMNRVIQGKGAYGGLFGPHHAALTATGVRRALGEITGQYDEILLTLPQDRSFGWGAPRVTDNYLYTREAFAQYWDHLRPGGLLVLLTGSEVSFARALLTAWEVALPAEGASLADHGWGIELAGLTPRLAPYHYLLILAKGAVAEALRPGVERVLGDLRDHGIADGIAISPLFGPGVEAKRHYRALHHPDGLAAARAVLGRAVSWKVQRLVDLSLTTDRRPVFFQAMRDLHPFLKGLLGGVLVVQAAVLLLPLGRERRLTHPDSGTRPPLPALLGSIAAATCAATLTATLLACHTAPLTGRLDLAVATVLTGLFMGTGGYRWHRRRRGAPPWPWLAAAALLAIGLTGGLLLASPQIAATWPWPLRLTAPTAAALPMGYLFALLLARQMDDLARSLPLLLPWAWLTVGLSLVDGAIAALWTAQSRGWPAVWLAASGAIAVTVAVHRWVLWVAPERTITTAGRPAAWE